MGSRRRVLAGVILAVLAAVIPAGVANASSDKAFTSPYDMVYRVIGATTFHVTGDGYVHVSVFQEVGDQTAYEVDIEREVCGLFGCKWKGYLVGKPCYLTLQVNASRTCTFNTGNSKNRHRVILTKTDDKKRVSGEVQVW